MFRNALKPWRFALVITLVAFLAFGTTFSLFGATVSPDVWPGNDPSVAEFEAEYEPECENVIKAKYDYGTPGNLVDGTFTEGDFSVDIVFGDEDEGEYQSVSFSNATHPVLGVFVKGGPDGGNMYYYPDGVYADTNLATPSNTGISHVSFYYCDDEMPEYGSLKVSKAVYGDDIDASELPDFVITVTGPGGYTNTQTIVDGGFYVLEDLVPGKYVVTEATLDDEWIVEYEVLVGVIADGEDNEVDVKVNTESHVLVKNTYDETEVEGFGSLTVYKEVYGASGLSELPDFDITVKGPEDFEDTQTIAAGESYTWFKLVPGIYTVTEDTSGFSAEWTVDYEVLSGEVTMSVVVPVGCHVEVFEDLESEVLVKNTYEEIEVDGFGSLTVHKEVFGDTSGLSKLPDFKITVTGPEGFNKTETIANGGSFTWVDLVPGIYTVTEDTSGFSAEWKVDYEVLSGQITMSTVVPVGCHVEVFEDMESEVLVKNTYDEIKIEAFGSLTVHKVVKGDVDELDELPEFLFTVTGPNGFTSTRAIKDGESYTWVDLEAGTYKVTEDKSKLSKGWTVTGEGEVEVEDDLESEITVTNTYNDLPDTGGDPVTMILSGLMLAGFGTVIRRRKQ